MLCSIQNLAKTKRSLVKIKEMLERIKGEEKIDVDTSLMFGNINSAIIDIVATLNLFGYCEKLIPSVSLLRNMAPNLKQQYDTLRKNEDTNIVEYIPVVEQLISSIELFEAGEFSNLGNYSLMKENFSGTWAYGNFLFPVNVLDCILGKIKKKTAFNLLDMNCGDAENLLHINKKFPYVNLYGISGKPEVRIPKEERMKIKRLVLGGLKNIVISNDSFDVVITTPRISFSCYDDSERFVPEEIQYLERALNYLRKDGLLIYPTPICAISKNVATFLSKNFKDVSIISDEKELPGVIVIMGTKKSGWDRDLDPKIFAFLRNIIVSPNLLEKQEEKSYVLPDNTIDVRRFRGGKLDIGEMNLLFSMSSIMKDFWKKQQIDRISNRTARPLLPFSIGQLGLVLTSGCLDGVIEEPDNCSHVVKGRVIKVVDTEREINDTRDQVEISSTTSNRVEISMFLPDGTYRCLI